jgi:hypothetical protein
MLEAIKSARYPQRLETSQATTAVNAPIHDWTSHYRTSMEYFFVNMDTFNQQATETPSWADKATQAFNKISYGLNRRRR